MSPKMSSKATFVLSMYILYLACVTCGGASYSSTRFGDGFGSAIPGQQPVTCPRDALKLGICANLLGMTGVEVGSPPTIPCCSVLVGLLDLEVAVCFCTAIRANVLGNNLNVPVSINLLLNVCGMHSPSGFTCA